MIDVLVADDQSLIRTAVSELISHAPDMQVVAGVANGVEALEAAIRLRPDVVVMDIRMPVMDGLEATRQITARPDLAATRILILTTFEEEEYVFQALRAGASGFVGKGTEPDDLIRAVRTVNRGDALLSPRATRSLINRYLVPTAPDAYAGMANGALSQLTEREIEVLMLVARGLSNDDIAAALVVSPLTVKTHINHAMMKLSAHDRAQLVIIAYESGLLRPGEAPP